MTFGQVLLVLLSECLAVELLVQRGVISSILSGRPMFAQRLYLWSLPATRGRSHCSAASRLALWRPWVCRGLSLGFIKDRQWRAVFHGHIGDSHFCLLCCLCPRILLTFQLGLLGKICIFLETLVYTLDISTWSHTCFMTIFWQSVGC